MGLQRLTISLKPFLVQTVLFQSAKILDHCAQAQRRIATKNQWHQLYLVDSSTKANKNSLNTAYAHQHIYAAYNMFAKLFANMLACLLFFFDIKSKFQQLQTCNGSLIHICPSCSNSLKLLLSISLIVNADNYLILIICKIIVNKIKFQKYSMLLDSAQGMQGFAAKLLYFGKVCRPKTQST